MLLFLFIVTFVIVFSVGVNSIESSMSEPTCDLHMWRYNDAGRLYCVKCKKEPTQ